ncbi:MAG: DUF1304 domain-containing protein [Rhizobiaceae bacterium]|nr:DUF1304 domain-containing protein [Rhizobiaceae bacterium]MCV0407310.1 DUF1304 domain-containing protein [Rhizobiaceae bacterium]
MFATIFTVIVAALHVWFMALEMIFWTKPLGRATFGTTAEFAEQTRALAANQGLYNGFLAAGLFWGLWLGQPDGNAITVFFLLCVLAAGLFGSATVSIRILLAQALPALLALGALMLGI